MLRKIKSHLAVLLMLALAFTLLIPAPVQAASKKKPAKVTVTSVKTSGYDKVTIKWAEHLKRGEVASLTELLEEVQSANQPNP